MRRSGEPFDEAGYSLLEMIVVLAVIALVGAALTMTMRRDDRDPSPSEIARQIAGAARAASTRAISSGRNSILNIDLTGRTVGVDFDPVVIRIPERLWISMIAAERPVVSGQKGIIEFFPDGSSTGGEIAVGATSSGQYLVRVFWLTGEITTRQAP